MERLLSVLFGVISSFVVVIVVEWLRQPRLTLTIPDPSDQSYQGIPTPAQLMRCVRVRVRNRELPWVCRWLRREAAENCRGSVQFLSLDGTNYFPDAMPARWTGSPEATPLRGVIVNGTVQHEVVLWDTTRLSLVSKMDIPAGEQEDLDMVVRCDQDEDCYGFNNESYRTNWRNERWRLPTGTYRVEIVVRSAGQKITKRFLLRNEGSRDDFRLENDPYPRTMGASGYPPALPPNISDG